MANQLLFKSSIFCTIIHILFSFLHNYNNLLLTTTVIAGSITSLLNHGLSFFILKFIDRFIMIICFFSNIYNIKNILNILKKKICYFLLLIAAFLYLLTKTVIKNTNIYLKNSMHISAHLIVATIHVILMSEYKIIT